jgi:predicted small secreted protein
MRRRLVTKFLRPIPTALVLLAVTAAGCGTARGCASGTDSLPAAAPPNASSAASEAGVEGAVGVLTFSGMCDASGAVQLSDRRFAVADDEDNVQRVYDGRSGGAALTAVDLSPALGLEKKAKRGTWPETDLEAGTRIGDRAYWITSHGRSSKGKLRPERLRFFATRVTGEAGAAEVVGNSEELLEALIREPRLARFALADAAELPPKSPGGFNIEGLTAMPDGGLLIGFRNPNPENKALLVPFANPSQFLQGEPARFGEPVLLDLEGRGIRSLSYWHGRYLIAAGHFANELPARLYVWDGKSAPRHVAQVVFRDFNPEGFFTPEQGAEVMLLSDDGERAIDGEACKKLSDPTRKRFRGAWVRIPD